MPFNVLPNFAHWTVTGGTGSSSSVGVTGLGTSGYLQKSIGPSLIDNSAVYESGGFVGINNAIPLTKLTIGSQSSTPPLNTNIWIAGAGGAAGSTIKNRISMGTDGNQDYGCYIGEINFNGAEQQVMQLGSRDSANDRAAMNINFGKVIIGLDPILLPVATLDVSGNIRGDDIVLTNSMIAARITGINISGSNIFATNRMTISGQTVITGGPYYLNSNPNNYATSGNIQSTGQTLDGKVNSLSGWVNNTPRVSAINVTGFGNQTGIINISGIGTVTVMTGLNNFIYVSGSSAATADHGDGINLSGNLTTTGQTLYTLLKNFTGITSTGLGTSGYLAKFNGLSGIINSAIFESGGFVSIGDSIPRVPLSIGAQAGTPPVNTKLWIAGNSSVETTVMNNRINIGSDANSDYGAYMGVMYTGAQMRLQLGTRWGGTDWPSIYTISNQNAVGLFTAFPVAELDVSGNIIGLAILANTSVISPRITGVNISGSNIFATNRMTISGQTVATGSVPISYVASISVTGFTPQTGAINISGIGAVTVLTGLNNFIYISGSSAISSDHGDGINLSGNLTLTGQTLYGLIGGFTGVASTGIGTSGYIAKFNERSGIVNSTIFEDGGLVGIKASDPQVLLHIGGNVSNTPPEGTKVLITGTGPPTAVGSSLVRSRISMIRTANCNNGAYIQNIYYGGGDGLTLGTRVLGNDFPALTCAGGWVQIGNTGIPINTLDVSGDTQTISLYAYQNISGSSISGNNISANNSLKISGQNVLTGNYIPPTFVTTGSGTINIDWSLTNTFRYVLSGDSTFTFSNNKDGQNITVLVGNTGTNFYSGIWPSNVNWPSGAYIAQSSGAKADIYTFIHIFTGIYVSVVRGFPN